VTYTIEVDEDSAGDLWVVRIVCHAAEDAICRCWCAEGCEETCYGSRIYVAAEPPELVAQAPTEGHRWAPIGSCRIVDWLEACGAEDSHDEEEPLRPGTHPIEADWDGDMYVWRYAEPDAAVTDAGVPL
jgi:hypothetical protein